MKRLVLTTLVGLFFAVPALAQDKSSGCGLGWMIFKKNSLVSSALRSTTNGIFWNQTLGMTFGTSGCAKHSIVQENSKGLHYAEANYHNLMVELATGHGEFVAAYAESLGCSWKTFDVFSKTMKENYESIYSYEGIHPSEVLENTTNQLRINPQLGRDCSAALI